MIPIGLGRILAIAATLAFLGYVVTGSSSLGVMFVAALVGTGLHWAFSGGWGEGSYARRAGDLPRAEATLGSQSGSAAQWIWYVVGVLGFLLLIFAMMAIAFYAF